MQKKLRRLSGKFRNLRIIAVILIAIMLGFTIQQSQVQPKSFLLAWSLNRPGLNATSNHSMVPALFTGRGIVADSTGNVYILDEISQHCRIVKFDTSGNYIKQWESPCSYGGIAVDSLGDVYLADMNYSYNIVKFYNNGTRIMDFGNYQFHQRVGLAVGIAVDSHDEIYVANWQNAEIEKFDRLGHYLTGLGRGLIHRPTGIALDSSGNIYETEADYSRVVKLDSSGNYVTGWGSKGSDNGQFNYALGIATDASGNVYVVDNGNNRVQEFTSSGSYLTQWGSQGSGDGQFNYPSGAAVDASGNVYIVDTGNDRIEKFGDTNRFTNLVLGIMSTVILTGIISTWLIDFPFIRKINSAMATMKRSRFLILGGATSLIFAAVTVFWNFQQMGLSHWDEYYYIGTAAWDMNVSWGRFQAVEPPLFPFILSIMFRIFGLHDFVAVATSGVMAILLSALTFWWTKHEYDVLTALVSVLVLASTSMFILYAKMALADMTLTFFFSAAIFAYAYALKKRSNLAFLVAGMLLALTVGVKYNGFLPLLVILTFVPFFYLSTFRVESSFMKGNSYFRKILSSVPKLLLSLVPSLVFALVFIAYLANPFPPSVVDIVKLFGDYFIIRLRLGWRVLLGLQDWYYVSSPSFRPLYSAEFYGNVLLEFVGPLVILLSIVGVASGLMNRKKSTVLLVIWVALVFVFFSSMTSKYPRVMLPLMVPLSVLAAQGTCTCASVMIRVMQSFSDGMAASKVRFGASLRVCLVILLILIQLHASIPAITNAHSGYREAAEFLAATVPNRIIFYSCQPVLLVYANSFGLGSQMTGGIGLLNQSHAVVIDFIATLSPDYPRIQARISHMTLVARISNDVPINMLDSTNFSGLRLFKADPDRMSIRIYLG